MWRLRALISIPQPNVVKRSQLVPHVPTRKRPKRKSRWFG
jgi:hypothetical protein